MEKCAFDWTYRNFILITCLSLVVFTKEESQQYSYECNENGDITLLGLLQNSKVTIKEVSYRNGSSVLSNCTFTADQYGHVIINRSCTDNFPKLRPKVVVLGILEDTSVLPTTVSSSQTSTPSILSAVYTSISSVMSPSTLDALVLSSKLTMSTSSTITLPTTIPISSSTTSLTLSTTASTSTSTLTANATTTQPITTTSRTTKTTQMITTKPITRTKNPSTPSTTTHSTTTPTTTTNTTTTQTITISTTRTTPKITIIPTTNSTSTTTAPTSQPSSTTTTPTIPTAEVNTTTTKTTTPLTTTISTTTTIPTTTKTMNTPSKFRKKRTVKNTEQTVLLTCQQFKNGVIHYILGQLINGDTISLNPVINSVGSVEMQFKGYRAETEDALNYLPDISTVYLGDKFFMFLKYMGQQDYKIVPQSCSAYDGGVAVTNSAKPNVSLWSYKRCVSDVARKYHLMHGFEKINDKIIFAELFGFHFVDDADITVECDVMICNKADKSSMCTLKQNDCGRTKYHRRARRTTAKYVKVVKKLKIMNGRQHYTENTAMKYRQNSLMMFIGAAVYGVEYILP